jgi:AcrR family transcriptional regulator
MNAPVVQVREETLPTRDRIVQVVIDALAELDPAALTIQQICVRSGVRPPTVYYHFGSKEGLVIEAVDALVTSWLGELEASVDRSGTLDQTLDQALEAWFGMITNPSRPFAVFVWVAMWSEASRAALLDGRVRALELLEEAISGHLGMRPGIDDLAGLILDGLLGAAIDYQLDADQDLLLRRLTALLAVARTFPAASGTGPPSARPSP